MQPLRHCFFSLLLLAFVSSPSTSLATSWFDDFNDGSIVDGSPVTWTFNEATVTPGSYDPNSGDLVLSAPGDPMPPVPTDPTDNTLAPSVGVSFTDTYARTQAITLPDDPNNEARGNAGILLRWNPFTVSGYAVMMDHGDELEIYRIDGGDPNALLIQNSVGVNTLTDAVMEVEMIGSQLSVFMWQAPSAKPSAPIATINDSTYSTGRVGLFFNEDSDGHFGVFRYALAQDTPILSGDFDGDGVVDAADLSQWEGDFGVNGDSDADFDGDSDGFDFLYWQRNYGSGSGSVTVIPEPGCLALVFSIVLCPMRWR